MPTQAKGTARSSSAEREASKYGPKELFRVAVVRPHRIVDVAYRAASSSGMKKVLSAPRATQLAWARRWLKGGSVVRDLSDLGTDYLAPLKIKELSPAVLPSRAAISDGDSFRATVKATARSRARDLDRCLKSAVAYRILNRKADLARATRVLQFVEQFPRLDRVARERRYAPLVLGEAKSPASGGARGGAVASVKTSASQPPAENPKDELTRLTASVDVLWKAKNLQVRALRQTLKDTRAEVLRTGLPAPQRKGDKSPTRRDRVAHAKRFRAAANLARQRIEGLRREYEEAVASTDLASTLEEDAQRLAGPAGRAGVKKIEDAKKTITELSAKHGLQPETLGQVYEQAQRMADATPSLADTKLGAGCFLENPRIKFQNEVRVLGSARLVKVTETFCRYEAGEISYVENILSGELRRREVRSSRYLEQTDESVREETKESTSDKSATTTQELHSQISTEISSRLDSDISSSVNASGGGNVGVVALEGGASVEGALQFGLDSSLSTENASDFAQEIVNRAVERVRSSSVERRLTRSTSLSETLNHHEINNIGGPSKNGVYCFLDKRACISEAVYGHRIFLLANMLVPGKNLLCEAAARRALDLADQGPRPKFDITPNDVTPSTYKDLVGRFRAANVKPPPAPVVTIGRTYKTDTTTEVVEQQGFDPSKIAKTLVPFFTRYKRFLVTDEIEIPPGYFVRDVVVTVNHGKNGISIPAHLPLSLSAAALFSAPVLAEAALLPIMLPYSLWQVAFLASPLCHYNSDSSNVTVCIGNEAEDSPYYFFNPPELVEQIVNLLSGFVNLGPEIIEKIRKAGETMMTALTKNAGAVPGAVATSIQGVIDSVAKNVKSVFDKLLAWLNVFDGGDTDKEWAALTKALGKLGAVVDVSALGKEMKKFFDPIGVFLGGVLGTLDSAVQGVLSDFMSLIGQLFDNSDRLYFKDAAGIRGKLPVSLNAVGLHPGVTVNLNAYLQRTEEALEQWRLETFGALYQSYLQQVAEYESRFSAPAPVHRRSPGLMREEEQRALKEIVIHSLNGLWNTGANEYDLDRINLFENSVDWGAMVYRLHEYGPNLERVQFEKLGFLDGIDEKRRSFLTAHWAQVMVPLRPDEQLERRLLAYVDSGVADLEADLADERLATLYQELILDRLQTEEDPETTHREVTLPTDLVVLKTEGLEDELPSNESCPYCTSIGAGGGS